MSIIKKLKKLGFKIKDREASFGKIIYKNGKAMAIDDFVLLPSEIGTGKYKKTPIYCPECGKLETYEKIEITREPTKKEIIKQDEEKINMIVNSFENKK